MNSSTCCGGELLSCYDSEMLSGDMLCVELLCSVSYSASCYDSELLGSAVMCQVVTVCSELWCGELFCSKRRSE
jgi:hypothetical protein